MTIRFTLLASGSAGNAALAQSGTFGVLLDAGLSVKELTSRLRLAGLGWEHVGAMLLTHTHSDHYSDSALAALARRGLPLYCHPAHHAVLERTTASFAKLLKAGLVCSFEGNEEWRVGPFRCRALPVRHDSGAAFGFRLDGPTDLFGRGAAVGYAADLGTWDEELAGQFADVDLLALEFNHDVEMERHSRRPAHLIRRVLGDEGHLSNCQAAALVRAVLARSAPGRLRHLVQLHLSRDCNRVKLAREAGLAAVANLEGPVEVHTGRQSSPLKSLVVGQAPRARSPRRGAPLVSRAALLQPWLPGLAPEPR